MFSGIAAQFIAMNGLSLRPLFSCMNFDNTSFPVPVGPFTSTVTSFAATRLTNEIVLADLMDPHE